MVRSRCCRDNGTSGANLCGAGMTWIAVCAPGTRILLRVLSEDLRDILACNWANAWTLLSSAGRRDLGLIFHVAIKWASDRATGFYQRWLARLLQLEVVLIGTVVASVNYSWVRAIVKSSLNWLYHGWRPREVINIYFVGDTVVKVALDPKRENTLSTLRRF